MGPGPSSMAGLTWLAGVGPSPLEAWGVAMSWGRRATYSHVSRLRSCGLLDSCDRRRGQGSLVYATRSGAHECGVRVPFVDGEPSPHAWPHHDASAWTAAWLTARGRELIGPRSMLNRREWRGELQWRERGELRRRGHRPDLAGRLPGGGFLPIEVELSLKSSARLKAVCALHARWVSSGHCPAVVYVCADTELAARVRTVGEAAGLSVNTGTLRLELLHTVKEEAVDARLGTPAGDWAASTLAVAA